MKSRRAIGRAELALLALLASGCKRTIHAEEYDQSCAADTDCEVIFVGDVCSCSCDVAAINVADHQTYVDDRGNQTCNISCGACPAVDPVCVSQVCQALSPL